MTTVGALLRLPNTNRLVGAVLEDLLTSNGRRNARTGTKTVLTSSEPGKIKDRILTELRHTAAILEAKAATDATAFKWWLEDIRFLASSLQWVDVWVGDPFKGVEDKIRVSRAPDPEEFWKALGL